jgi:hypothetical protein
VRHDPVLGALADLGRRRAAAAARDHGLPARLRHPAHRLRRAVRRQALGPPARDYDTERGISYWTKNYRTSIEATDPEALSRTYEYYDPIHTLPAAGQEWWQQHGNLDESALKAAEVAEASRRTAALQAY